SLFLLSIKTPVGTSIQATDAVFRKAEDFLRKQSEVKDLYTTIGNYNGNDVVNAGNIYVILTNAKSRKFNQRQIMDRTRDDLQKLLPAAQVFGQDLSLTGLSASRGFPVEFTIEGPEWGKLAQVSRDLTDRLAKTGLLEDINTDFQDGMPEIDVIPDRI